MYVFLLAWSELLLPLRPCHDYLRPTLGMGIYGFNTNMSLILIHLQSLCFGSLYVCFRLLSVVYSVGVQIDSTGRSMTLSIIMSCFVGDGGGDSEGVPYTDLFHLRLEFMNYTGICFLCYSEGAIEMNWFWCEISPNAGVTWPSSQAILTFAAFILTFVFFNLTFAISQSLY